MQIKPTKKLRILANLILILSFMMSILTTAYASIEKVRIGVFGMS